MAASLLGDPSDTASTCLAQRLGRCGRGAGGLACRLPRRGAVKHTGRARVELFLVALEPPLPVWVGAGRCGARRPRPRSGRCVGCCQRAGRGSSWRCSLTAGFFTIHFFFFFFSCVQVCLTSAGGVSASGHAEHCHKRVI